MPELPEVETIARQIRAAYLDRRIVEVEASPVIIFQNISANEFAKTLAGKTIRSVSRYGKFLYWQAEDVFPVFHLGMSGVFIRDSQLSSYPQHIHIRFTFDDGRHLCFQDVRKFSKIYLYHQPPDFSGLGIDPTKENFTLINFRKLLNLKKMNIKSFLMDQKILAGIGNIYASEALFDAEISPFRRANELSKRESERLYFSILRILNSAIDRFGTTYTAYRTVDGTSGNNQHFLQVYQRAGQPCYRCGKTIEKIVQNSRSTFFCPHCQR